MMRRIAIVVSAAAGASVNFCTLHTRLNTCVIFAANASATSRRDAIRLYELTVRPSYSARDPPPIN